jgi:hypothetical protein
MIRSDRVSVGLKPVGAGPTRHHTWPRAVSHSRPGPTTIVRPNVRPVGHLELLVARGGGMAPAAPARGGKGREIHAAGAGRRESGPAHGIGRGGRGRAA